VSGPGAYAEVILYTLPGAVIGLVFHELAHASLALRFGDPSPRRERRLSIDPRKQLDAIGCAALLIAGFGWARPLQLNPPQLQGRLQRALVIAAGPAAHLVVAALFAATLRLELLTSGIDISGFVTTAQSGAQAILTGALLQGFFINIALCVYSLVPLPGLDGYALVRSLVFPRAARVFLWLEARRLVVYALAVVAVALPAELTQGAVNPLAAATVGTASAVFSHGVQPGVTPIFLGLPNIFMLFG
jgi:Zn-dependent protease